MDETLQSATEMLVMSEDPKVVDLASGDENALDHSLKLENGVHALLKIKTELTLDNEDDGPEQSLP